MKYHDIPNRTAAIRISWIIRHVKGIFQFYEDKYKEYKDSVARMTLFLLMGIDGEGVPTNLYTPSEDNQSGHFYIGNQCYENNVTFISYVVVTTRVETWRG